MWLCQKGHLSQSNIRARGCTKIRRKKNRAVWSRSIRKNAALDQAQIGPHSGPITSQQAAMAYSNDFLFMTFISLCAFPLLALIRSPKAVEAAASREAAAHAVMD